MARRGPTELGERLKRLAHAAGFTAETLAERLGCSPSAVWAWWSGRNEPGVEAQLRALATVPDAPLTAPPLLTWLAAAAERFPALWEKMDEEGRREMVNVFIERVDILCEPAAPPRAWRREVVGVRLQPWLSPVG